MANTTYMTAAAAPAKADAAIAGTTAKAPGLFSRIVKAMQDSRQRQAEIEIRRMRALIGDPKSDFREALLPFKGE
jgi:hypothetical protein